MQFTIFYTTYMSYRVMTSLNSDFFLNSYILPEVQCKSCVGIQNLFTQLKYIDFQLQDQRNATWNGEYINTAIWTFIMMERAGQSRSGSSVRWVLDGPGAWGDCVKTLSSIDGIILVISWNYTSNTWILNMCLW